MPTSQDVSRKIDAVIDLSGQTFKDETQLNYETLQSQIADLEGLAREAFQAKLEDLYWPILEKLEEGKSLTAAEHDVLEMLMVGEAKYYLRYETNKGQWRSELERLMDEIKKQQAAGLAEIDSLMRVRALCREALRIVPDMAYYFGEKERVRKFEDATRDAIDTETRRALANLIKEMIESDQL